MPARSGGHGTTAQTTQDPRWPGEGSAGLRDLRQRHPDLIRQIDRVAAQKAAMAALILTPDDRTAVIVGDRVDQCLGLASKLLAEDRVIQGHSEDRSLSSRPAITIPRRRLDAQAALPSRSAR